MVPLLLLPLPVEQICENGTAPASSAFGSGGEDAVCGDTDLEGRGMARLQRVRPLAVVARTRSAAAQTWRAKVGLLLWRSAWKRLEE